MTRRGQEQVLRQKCNLPELETVSKYSEVQSLREVPLDKHYGGIYSLQYNFDGSQLVAGFSGGGVRMYNPITGELIRELRPNRHGGYPIMCMRYHPSRPELLYVGSSEGHVYIIDTESGEGAVKPAIIEKGNEINTIDFNAFGDVFCTCGKDLAVRVYNSKTNKEQKTYEGYGSTKAVEHPEDCEAGNTMRVFSLKFSPEYDDIFLTVGWDNHIKIWDLRTNDGIKRQIMGPHVCGEALDIRGFNILTGSWCANHALQEWDYREGKLIRDIKFPSSDGSFLYCAQYADDVTVLAGGSGTNSVEAIEKTTNRHIGSAKMTKVVRALDCSEGGKLFAVGGSDDMLKLCALK